MPHPIDRSTELADLLGRPISVAVHTDAERARLRDALGRGPEPLLVESLQRLFDIARPPIEVLRLVKDFAKSNLAAHGGAGRVRGSPQRTAYRVIYLAAIASAAIRCGQRISALDDATLRRQYGWAGRVADVPAGLQQLFAAARAGLVPGAAAAAHAGEGVAS